MGNKVNHYYNGIQWMQLPNGGITDAELTITDGVGGTGSGAVVANRFISMKDSNDTLWVLAGTDNTANNYKAKLFSITSAGVKSMVWLNWASSGYIPDNTGQPQIQESRDGLSILVKGNYNQAAVYMFTKATFASKAGLPDASRIIATGDTFKTFNTCTHIAVYQDQYVWRRVGYDIYLNDYTNMTQKGIDGVIGSAVNCHCLLKTNRPSPTYIGGTWCVVNGNYLSIYIYNEITISHQALIPANISTAIVMHEDKWGNIVYMTNESPAKLCKGTITWSGTTPVYTAIGNITLGSQCYTFDTDIDGNYFYSNAGGTWMIPANTAVDENFSAIGTHIKIRNVGMTTYNNSLTGYFPATKG